MLDFVLRRLARDQWVRLHGTPRVTVLVGGPRGREIWYRWLALTCKVGTLFEVVGDGGEAGGASGAREGADGRMIDRTIDAQIRAAVARAIADPAHPTAVLATAEAAARWRAGRRDRLAAMVDEGWIAVPEPVPEPARPAVRPAVRSTGRGGSASAGGGSASADGCGGRVGERRRRLGGCGERLGIGGRRRRLGVCRRRLGVGERRRRLGGCGRRRLGVCRWRLSVGERRRWLGVCGRRRLGVCGGGDPRGTPEGPFHFDARSLAEATLFEALEATPATAGRFRLNESLSVRFGPTAAEIDLLSRGDRIAIEIDGVHHFADPDCYRRDRRKDLLLQTQGFVVVRLLAEDVVRDVRAAVTEVVQALAYRLGEGRG